MEKESVNSPRDQVRHDPRNSCRYMDQSHGLQVIQTEDDNFELSTQRISNAYLPFVGFGILK